MIKHNTVSASPLLMNSAICYADAHCAIGPDLSTVRQRLSATPGLPDIVSFDRLTDPVTQPYFALGADAQAQLSEGLFASLLAMVQRALDVSGLNNQQRARTGLFVGSSSFNARASEIQYQRALDSNQADQAIAFPDIG